MAGFTPLEQAALQHAAAFATDLGGRLEFANAQYCLLRGARAEEIVGQRLPWVARLAAQAEKTDAGPLWHGELPPTCGEGLLGTIVPRRDAAGALTGFLCFISQQAPAAPTGLPAHDPTLVGIFLSSAEGEPLFISDEIHARYTRLPAELCGLLPSVCSLEHWQATPDSGWRLWLRGREPTFTSELELTTRAGETERLQQRATRLLVGGRCLGIAGTLSVIGPTAGRTQRQHVGAIEPAHGALLDRLLGHAARFAQDLLRAGRLHDLCEVEDFLQGLATVALASQSGRSPAAGLACEQPA